MSDASVLEYEWPYLRTMLPSAEELEASAATYGAIVRRREVSGAELLLRVALAYGYGGLSLRQTAAWAEASGIAFLSDVALLKRLRNASDWLGHLLGCKLAELTDLGAPAAPLRLRLVDVTSIARVGSAGSDWRVHLSFNLTSSSIDHIELTDNEGGESLNRFPASPGDLVVGDRGYAHRRGFHAIRRDGADFLVRIPWRNTPLQSTAGDPFDLIAHLRSLPDAKPTSVDLFIAPDQNDKLSVMPTRLVAIRKSEAAAEKSRRNVLADRSRKQATVDPQTLEAAAYVILVTSTTDDQLPATQALEVFRFRWQIEQLFNRLKGRTRLGTLPAKDIRLARSMLYAKLLAALVLDQFSEQFLAISPWGFPIHR